MKQNVGYFDRFVRLLITVLLIWLYFSNTVTGIWGIVLLVLGAVFLLTGVIGFCPIYAIFGLKSNRKKFETK